MADRIALTGVQPCRLLPGSVNAADLAFNSFRRSKLTDTVFPEKLPRYVACGRPVLATPLPPARESLEGERNGVVFRELGPDFIYALAAILGDPQLCAQLGSAARTFVEANYEWNKTIDVLEDVLALVVDEARRTA